MNTIAIPHADKGYTAISQINKLEEYIFNLFCNLEKHIIFITSSDAHVPQNLKTENWNFSNLWDYVRICRQHIGIAFLL